MGIYAGCWKKSVVLENITAKDIMTADPKTISQNELAVDALDLMRKNGSN